MSKLPEELIELINDPAAVKLVGTVDAEGTPHLVVKGTLTTLDGEHIVFAEGYEGTKSNKNLVRSIWFDGKVSINVTKGISSYQIKGRPYKYLITGSVFRTLLDRAREKRGPEADIAGVWVIVPEEVRNESPGVRAREVIGERGHFHQHLDLLRHAE
ncbi:MAG: pyridoxamine 5'-phosphate oxidase family protein [Chlorobiaceae bacterium]|nr:pyridoxamine 5'-phosphate oxidase family protein [Chlorobiaceae bacterium]